MAPILRFLDLMSGRVADRIRRDLPEDMPEFSLPSSGERPSLSRLLVTAGLASSNGEAKRLINQNAVQLIRSTEETEILANDSAGERLKVGDVIKVGRRRFVRLTE